ncbi:MATE efflux family protein [Klebsormidium nitens]|uniref:Protein DETOXIFICATION n=1 Tax=Klebsormidium nitens TaxID=105231 RepID=A0A1Y1HQD9_KLENI|nr:MATE efflux family protein [Klebsormidium nitens]|eukprot:GAQ78777.1 MATE efflux family protein [Klebsormidium nitens]
MAVSSRAVIAQLEHRSFSSSCCRRDPSDVLLANFPAKPVHLPSGGALSKDRRRGHSEVHKQKLFCVARLINNQTRRRGCGTASLQNGLPADEWHRSSPENALGPSIASQRRGQSDVRTLAAGEAASIEEAQLDEAALKVQEGKRQIGLALPIFGTQMVQLLLVLSSSVFVGRLGEFQLAVAQLGVSLGNATGHYVVNGLALGLETLCGQSYGGSELMEVGRTVQCALVVQFVLAGVVSCLWLNSEPLLLALNQEPALAAGAAKYLKYLIPGLMANACLQPLCKYLQSLEKPRPFAVCSALALALHVPTNWLLIHKWGLGLEGAAMATSIAYIVNLVLLAGYTVFSGVYKSSWPKWSLSSLKKTGPFLKLAVPSMIMLCLEYLTYDILIIWCGWLPNPTRTVAAFSVALNTAWLFATLYIGLSSALSTRVATELGAKDVEGAKRVARVGMPLAAGFGLGSGLLLLAVHRWWPRIFIDRADVALFKLTSQVIVMYAFVCIEDCLSFNLGGIVRGLGRQDTGAAITFSSYYVVALPLAWYFCFKRNMGVFGLLSGVGVGLLFQVTALAAVVLTTDWQKMADLASAAQALPEADSSPGTLQGA